MGKYRRTCSKCHGPKEAGRGLRYCLSCERKPSRPAGTKAPCHACGTRENKLPGKYYCEECSELRRWRDERKAKTRKMLDRKPCRRCGGRKVPGHGQQFCEACKALNRQPRMCQQCQVAPVRAHSKRLCVDCVSKNAEENRRRERERGRRRTRDRDTTRVYRQRMKQDPQRRARDLESQRLRHRLRAIQEGREPRNLRSPSSAERAWLPGRALAATFDHLAVESDLSAVCELAGVPCRQVTRWRRGEQGVSTNDADLVLTGLDLLWWDVWHEQSVRIPLFEVHCYQWLWKAKGSTKRRLRVRTRTVLYGDQGPDTAKLSEIAALMVGEAVAA